MNDELMIPEKTEGDLRAALIRAVGWDRLSEPQRELALSIAQRYHLDPLLRHLVMIEGSPYITRDALLHVAHRSGKFDGIEVSNPVLDEKADAKGRRFWRCRAKVWRKDFSRPFEYPGRYPDNGRNSAYAEEMAIKVAEVFTLRRAFDVSAPTIEERWVDEDQFPGETTEEPSSLADKIAARAAALEAQEDEPAVVVAEAVSYPDDLATDLAGDETSPPVSDEEAAVAEAEEVVAMLSGPVEVGAVRRERPVALADDGETVLEDIDPTEPMFTIPAIATTAEQSAFQVWAEPRLERVRKVVREAFPDATRLLELTPAQMTFVRSAVDAEETEAVKDEVRKREALEDPDEPSQMGEVRAATSPKRPVECGHESPLSGAVCNLDKGHKGVHRNGLREAWDRA